MTDQRDAAPANTSELVVGGLVLPRVALRIGDSLRWSGTTDQGRPDSTRVREVFGEQPDRGWLFYSRDEIVAMTLDWHEEEDLMWFGRAPDDIDPARSVLIGELGYDRPFALDYRDDGPSVRLMTLEGTWLRVAESLDILLDRLEAA